MEFEELAAISIRHTTKVRWFNNALQRHSSRHVALMQQIRLASQSGYLEMDEIKDLMIKALNSQSELAFAAADLCEVSADLFLEVGRLMEGDNGERQ